MTFKEMVDNMEESALKRHVEMKVDSGIWAGVDEYSILCDKYPDFAKEMCMRSQENCRKRGVSDCNRWGWA